MRIRNITPLFAICFSHSARGQFCYYPGANAQAFDQRPCDAHAVTSLCCPIGWTCFSNKLCVVTDANAVNQTVAVGTTIRGTCTDPLWNSTVCGDFCLNEPVNDNGGSLIPCGDNVFACSPEARNGIANCANGKGVFSVAQGTPQTVIGQSTFGSIATPSVPISSSTSSSSSSSSTTRATSSASHASSVATPTPTESPAKHKFKVGYIAGPIVAVFAIVCLLIGAWCWCHPRRERLPPTIDPNPPQPDNVHGVYRPGPTSTFASEVSTLAPFPHPYSPPSSPPPQANRAHVFGPLGVREDDPYQQGFKPPQAYSPPPQGFTVPRRNVGEMGV